MKKTRNKFRCVTKGGKDSVILHGRHRAVCRKEMNGDEKWILNEEGNIPIFEDLGILPDKDRVVIGKNKGSLYLVQMINNPSPVCKIKAYETYRSDEFMWLHGNPGSLRNPMIGENGRFLVNLRTGDYVRCPEPPKEKELGKVFEISGEIKIRWVGSGFEKTQLGEVDLEEKGEKREIDDMRKDELESYLREHLRENVELNVTGGPDLSNMSEVDMSRTPQPIVEVFYDLGDGSYPEDQDGDFEPPDKSAFVEHAYKRFKNSTEDDAFRKENREAWYKRLEKAWASLVRDVHFSYMMFQEQETTECFDDVEFDMERDIEEGVDFVVEKDEKEYHINLFIESQKSRKFIKRKEKYRQPESDAVGIEVPMHIWGAKRKEFETKSDENMWLYTEEHVNGIKQIVLGNEDEVIDDENGKVLCKKI